jgi:uncharacterized protein YicC (UPF0701 family)
MERRDPEFSLVIDMPEKSNFVTTVAIPRHQFYEAANSIDVPTNSLSAALILRNEGRFTSQHIREKRAKIRNMLLSAFGKAIDDFLAGADMVDGFRKGEG